MRTIPSFLLALLLLAASASAQEGTALANRFFRATITLNTKPLLAESIFKDTEGHFVVKGASLASVIARAYGVQPHQVVDAPDWVYQDHLYDIDAEPPPPALLASDDTQMLQALLVDRFGLQTGRAARSIEMLAFDSDRERQAELARAADCDGDARRAAGAERARRNGGAPNMMNPDTPRCIATNFVLAALERQTGEEIHDLTGLVGVYVLGGLAVRPAPNAAPLEQLLEVLARSGLTLERRSVDMDLVVVTAVRRPVIDAIDRQALRKH